jgi:hypothetical protein
MFWIGFILIQAIVVVAIVMAGRLGVFGLDAI